MKGPSICVAVPDTPAASETFLRAHIEGLPADVHVVSGLLVPSLDGRSIFSQSVTMRAWRKVTRTVRQRPWSWETTGAQVRAIKAVRPIAVVAEYGPTGVQWLEACRHTRTPLIVHFHGYDASIRTVLDEQQSGYRRIFSDAAAVIAVSRVMEARLLSLGADRRRLHYSPYGVDCTQFSGADPARAHPTLLAVGRFVAKKAPHLTILAFAKALSTCPEARLRMVGSGPLLSVCQDLVRGLGIEHAVSFLGTQRSDAIRTEMAAARAFVQHSVEAPDGDSEGTPVAIIEAGATGLPVVATRHAGIPDVIVPDETGLLVDEHDIASMAASMVALIQDPTRAGALGAAAAERVRRHFSLDASLKRLWMIIESAVEGTPS